MIGSILNYDGLTRTGTLEGPDGKRYFFRFMGNVLLKADDEVEFDGCVDNQRRVAWNLKKVDR